MYVHAIWHKVPCNVFIVFLKQSDASEQGEAAKMTTFWALHASRAEAIFPAKISGPPPGRVVVTLLNRRTIKSREDEEAQP